MNGLAPRFDSAAALVGVLALAVGCASEPRYAVREGEPVGEVARPLVPAYPINTGPTARAEAPPGEPRPVFWERPPAAPEASSAARGIARRTMAPSVKPAPIRTRRTPDTFGYTVAKGDTLYGVARRFGLPPAKLAGANDLGTSARLHPDAHLSIPPAAHDRGEQAHASGLAMRTPGRLITLAASTERAVPSAPALAQPKLAVREPPAAPTDGPVPYAQLVGATRARTQRTPSAAAASVAAAPSFGEAPTAPSALPDSRAISQAGQGRFIRPVVGATLATFGDKGPGQRNDGVDLAAREGEAVRAAAPGVVVYAGHDVPALGNLVAIKHADGWVTVYGNLEKITVRPADHLLQGAEVGVAGATNVTPRAQVHFEVRYAPDPAEKARPVDPELVLPKAG